MYQFLNYVDNIILINTKKARINKKTKLKLQKNMFLRLFEEGFE